MSKNIILAETPRKRLILFAMLAIIGVLLLVLGKCTASDLDDKNSGDGLAELDPSKYEELVEEKVEALCNKIDGVSSTYAVVTLKGGYRAIYATDSQSGSSNLKNQTVLIGSGSSEKALLIGYENPEIAGIGIVCSGGDDAYVRAEIISMISAAFDLGSNKIFVSGT